MTVHRNPDIKSNDELVAAIDHQKVDDLIKAISKLQQNAGFIAPEEYSYRVHGPMTDLINKLAKELQLLHVSENFAKAMEKIKEAKTLDEAKKIAAEALGPVIIPVR